MAALLLGTAGALCAALGCGTSTAPGKPCQGNPATIVSVGDMLLADAAEDYLQEHGYDYPFRKVMPLLQNADLVMGNLEGPVTAHGDLFMENKTWSYKQPLEVAQALRDAGFDVLALANNHTLDYGPRGLQDTLRVLRAVGLQPLGAGATEEEARRGMVVELEGTKVGLLAYLAPYGAYEDEGWFAAGDKPGSALLQRAQVREDIARLRRQADVVIVHCHYGRNYEPPTRSQERASRAIIDMGADAVNGHHSHVAQGVEIYKGRPILYSLGNFTFGTPGRFEAGKQGYGLVARYHICDGGIRRVDLDLIGTNNKLVHYQPTPIDAAEAQPILEALVRPYGTMLRWEGKTAVIDLP